MEEITRRTLLGVPFGLASSIQPVYGSPAQPRVDSPAAQPICSVPWKAIWSSSSPNRRVWGYANRHSVNPGESFKLMLSTGPDEPELRGRIEIFRIGYNTVSDRRLVWQSSVLSVAHRDIQVTSAALGTDWPPIIDNVPTRGWASGYYTVDFVLTDGSRDKNIAYIVVTNPSRLGDILLILSTNTYNAYNDWGGYSLYKSVFVGDRAQLVSFDRPSSTSFFDYEYYLLMWLELICHDHNLRLDFATNFDLYNDPLIAETYPLLISGSHNEYWSKEEFDRIFRRIFKLGKSTLFLGANTAFWQVRYADLSRAGPDYGRQLVCFKSSDPIRQRVGDKEGNMLATDRFRDGARLPETMLTGVAYQSYFREGDDNGPKYSYYVSRTDQPFFKGTGYKVGDDIGPIVGYEWDNRDPDGNGKRLWDPALSQIPAIDPAAIKVLFTGSPVDVDGHQGNAEAVYFRSKAGAEVFTAGSIRWSWGLGKPGFESDAFRTFNLNLLLHALRRG